MLQTKTLPVHIALMCAAVLALNACDRSPASPAKTLPAADTRATSSHFEALMAEDEFAVGAKTPHCIALIGEIKAHRLALTQSSDWKEILGTAEWTRFDGFHTGYKSGGCPSLTQTHSGITQPCLEGRKALFLAWDDIEKLDSWKRTKQSAQIEGLVARWDDAKATGCVVVPAEEA